MAKRTVKKFMEAVELPGTTDWANNVGATLLEYVHSGGDVLVDRIVGDLAAIPSAVDGESGVLVIGVGLVRADTTDAAVDTLLASEAKLQEGVRNGQLWYVNRKALMAGVPFDHEFQVLTARKLRSGDKIQVGVYWKAYDGVQSDNIQMSAHMMGFAIQL